MADFVLGRIKFVWKGDWATTTTYVVDDVVKHGGSAYVCKTNHTSGTFATDLAATKWEEMVGGTDWKGAHANSTAYKVNDLVKHGASVFICTTAHTSSSAVLDTTKFTTYVGGVEFEDSYASGTAYQIGDIVTYGGYSYVNIQAATGQTPYNNTSYWEVLTTGYSAQGTWSSGTAYKIGHVVIYGGNTYVMKVDTSAGQLPSNTSYADLLVQGVSLQGTWAAGSTYKPGETVIYQNSTYRAKQDVVAGVLPTGLGDNWELYTQGDPAGVLATQGDIIVRGSVSGEALSIGRAGQKLIVDKDGTGLLYAKEEVGNKYHVSVNGSDTNPGTLELPFATIKHAAATCTTSGIGQITTIAGGTGGTPGTYRGVAVTGGSSSGTTADVTTDGSSTPTVTIVNNGEGWTEGNTGTIALGNIGNSSANLTFTVDTVTLGDIIEVHQGTYEEQFPIILKAGTAMQGDSLRGSRVEPSDATSTEVKTVDTIGANNASRTPGTYTNVATTSSGSGTGLKVTVVIDGSSTITVTPTFGGANYAVNDTITIADSVLGGGGAPALTCDVATLSANNATTMFLVNNNVNCRQMTFTGMYNGAKVFALDPNGAITTTSPYIQNCTSVNTGTTGLYIDGDAQASGYKSMLANDFTQVNSDGKGVHALNGARAELVSVFTYYCDKGYEADSGATLRCCNCCNAYGEYGAYAQGTDPDETPVTIVARGKEIVFQAATLSGVTAVSVGDTLTGATSGATATVVGSVTSTRKVQIDSITGIFSRGEVVNGLDSSSTAYTFTLNTTGGEFTTAKTITGVTQANPGVVTSASHGLSNGNEVTIKDVAGMTQLNGNKYFVKSVATNTFELASTVGGTSVDTSGFGAYSSAGSFIPTNAISGQTGYLIRVDSSDGTLGTAGKISVGSNIEFNYGAMPNASALISANKEFIKDEAMSWFDTTYPGAHTSERHIKCERDVGYTVDALVADLANDNADLTKEYARKYWVGAVSQLADATERTYAVAVFNKVKDIVNTKILVNSAWTTGQSPVVTTQSYTASDGENGSTTRVTDLITIFNDVSSNGLGVVPVGNGGKNYAVVAVTDEDTSNQRATVKIGSEITLTTTPVANNVSVNVRSDFSNIRLTGHDFLHIGTGSYADTNYPNSVGVTQPADQSKETTELSGGRCYFTSTDQAGNFRVGPQFRVDQATGTATLNADAFNLSGLTELQLGSIGAQIGAMINEFSTDGTLAGNSDVAVPTEQAVKSYVDTNSDPISGRTAEATVNDADTLLIYDASATAVRKMTRANFASGLGGISMGKAIAAAIVFG